MEAATPAIKHEFQICVIGDAGVGKSSIIQRFANKSFSEAYVPTIGVDFESAVLQVDGSLVRIKIYDLSGQPRFLACAAKHIATSDAFLYVYDVTQRDSFISIKEWYKIVNKQAKASNLPRILLGNRLDQRHRRMTCTVEAKEFSIPENMKYIETSAANGKNVDALFYILAHDVISYRCLGAHEKFGQLSNHSKALCNAQQTPEVCFVPEAFDCAHVFRILLMGATRSGKSTIRLRYCRNHFSPRYYPSAGLECSSRSLCVDNENVKVLVWDVSGDDLYESIRRSYYRGANAYVLVYDITSRQSFEHAQRMLKELDMYEQADCPKVLVGNKSDKSLKRAVTSGEAREWATGWRLPYVEVSAKNSTEIDGAFMKLIIALKDNFVPWKQVYNFSAT